MNTDTYGLRYYNVRSVPTFIQINGERVINASTNPDEICRIIKDME